MTKNYQFTEKVWVYPGKAAWYFVTLPTEMALEIHYYFSMEKRGWGSLPVEVVIGTSAWKTSIFPDKSSQSFLLPLKADVRKKESITVGSSITVTMKLTSY